MRSYPKSMYVTTLTYITKVLAWVIVVVSVEQFVTDGSSNKNDHSLAYETDTSLAFIDEPAGHNGFDSLESEPPLVCDVFEPVEF
jgi:hypothetical protein